MYVPAAVPTFRDVESIVDSCWEKNIITCPDDLKRNREEAHFFGALEFLKFLPFSQK